MPGKRKTGDDWSADAKLAVVIEAASLSEAEMGAYCREKGLYPEQVQRWKDACLQGADKQEEQEKAAQQQRKKDRQTIKKLESELRQKDHVLAVNPATWRNSWWNVLCCVSAVGIHRRCCIRITARP